MKLKSIKVVISISIFKILKDGDHDSRSAAQFSSKINMKRGPITFFFVLLNNNKKKNGGIYTPGVKL